MSHSLRAAIHAELRCITPLDELEREHLADTLGWVASGAELFRLAKPATPPRHLVSYFAVVDGPHILLVDHLNAQLWLPAGGHVEPGEHPRATVVRELLEELGLRCHHPVEPPLMVTCTPTVGLTAGHVDVSLWYVVHADRQSPIVFDCSEFFEARWFAFSDVPLNRADPHLGRFIQKLIGMATRQPLTSHPSQPASQPVAECRDTAVTDCLPPLQP
ncbi:NUDIX hydrolase [Ideonella sp. DXS29W]|uniref:NUDIX hydrolase n=1 Tax=Ideonella lacteola TaxID=2984193 RepID=A0ABU9BIX8_9BURK